MVYLECQQALPFVAMTTMQDWFDAYGESHQNPTNKAVHWICVPAIFFSLIGLLSVIPSGWLNSWAAAGYQPYLHVGKLLIVGGMVFFLRLSLSISIGMALVSAFILYGVKAINGSMQDQAWMAYLGIFVVAWIGQFIGHKIEGAKPSFLDDIKFLLIGPAWLLHFLYRKAGIRI